MADDLLYKASSDALLRSPVTGAVSSLVRECYCSVCLTMSLTECTCWAGDPGRWYSIENLTYTSPLTVPLSSYDANYYYYDNNTPFGTFDLVWWDNAECTDEALRTELDLCPFVAINRRTGATGDDCQVDCVFLHDCDAGRIRWYPDTALPAAVGTTFTGKACDYFAGSGYCQDSEHPEAVWVNIEGTVKVDWGACP